MDVLGCREMLKPHFCFTPRRCQPPGARGKHGDFCNCGGGGAFSVVATHDFSTTRALRRRKVCHMHDEGNVGHSFPMAKDQEYSSPVTPSLRIQDTGCFTLIKLKTVIRITSRRFWGLDSEILHTFLLWVLTLLSEVIFSSFLNFLPFF